MLACGYFSFDTLPDWQVEFDDIEQTMSLHRWNWLLTSLTSSSDLKKVGCWGVMMMKDWLSRMNIMKDNAAAWSPYTTGERICNGSIFLLKTYGWQYLPQDILNSFEEKASFLVMNLEYKPDGVVFNHLLNNARALYFGGSLLRSDNLRKIAMMIFKEETSRIINNDGFLREGSSHYQFLVTRWFLEVFWLSGVTGDDRLYSELKGILHRMIQACWFFLVFNTVNVDWEIPLIGDVSPDFTPEWLKAVPWSGIALDIFNHEKIPVPPKEKGWAILFPANYESATMPDDSGIFGGRSFVQFPESGWFRLDYEGITIFWHIEPTGSPLFPSHSHCDTGSFVLFLNGEKILVDPGRFSYMNDNEGEYGITASAHNQVTVDGYDPFVYLRRTRYPEFYRKIIPEFHYRWMTAGFEFIIRHNGFGRISSAQISFERIFRVMKNRVYIQDNFSGKGRHNINTYFHWAPSIDVVPQNSDLRNFRIQGANKTSMMYFTLGDVIKHNVSDRRKSDTSYANVKIINDWYFPAYGRKVPAKTIVFTSETEFPAQNSYLLTWNG
jgi:hypothetical protein